eukprot:GHVU01125365.1.p1 GENE.GHVU01125365.1~~GHVU01125365.1.p1  ORF type:complete len:416 (+),score=32.26 GHVU01125365.1:1912-3159(+)
MRAPEQHSASKPAPEPIKASHTQASIPDKEIVIERATGLPRQAGADLPEGQFVTRLRKRSEESLYIFSKAIMGLGFLTKSLHMGVCESLQQVPPFRKLRLLPRDHCKTAIVAGCLPAHILIQPPERNLYFPRLDNFAGTECRILLTGETDMMARKNLRVLRMAFEGNQLLRAFWPDAMWDEPRREAAAWNEQQVILPRATNYPDPSIRAIGVGGAITGSRPNVLIKDDLISLEAANSDVVMQAAIEWHKVSRALMDEYEKNTGMESLEFIIGTRWAVYDLYSYIMDNDPSVDVNVRAIIENGKYIWPEKITEAKVTQLQREYGSLFYLLYMNSVADPSLTDFDLSLIREFKYINDGKHLEFSEDDRDSYLVKRAESGSLMAEKPPPRGQLLSSNTWGMIFGSDKGAGQYMRLKYR